MPFFTKLSSLWFKVYTTDGTPVGDPESIYDCTMILAQLKEFSNSVLWQIWVDFDWRSGTETVTKIQPLDSNKCQELIWNEVCQHANRMQEIRKLSDFLKGEEEGYKSGVCPVCHRVVSITLKGSHLKAIDSYDVDVHERCQVGSTCPAHPLALVRK